MFSGERSKGTQSKVTLVNSTIKSKDVWHLYLAKSLDRRIKVTGETEVKSDEKMQLMCDKHQSDEKVEHRDSEKEKT